MLSKMNIKVILTSLFQTTLTTSYITTKHIQMNKNLHFPVAENCQNQVQLQTGELYDGHT